MSKFGRWGGNGDSGKLPSRTGGKDGVPTTAEARRARYLSRGKEVQLAGAGPQLRVGSNAVAIALDATGSMAALIEGAKENIGTILRRVYDEASVTVTVRIYVYRDYDVPEIVVEHSPRTERAAELEAWLANVQATGGGSNAGEAIEAALARIHDQDDPAVVLVAGDEPSNPRQDLDGRGLRDVATAHDWARRFGQNNVPVHTFVVDQRPDTVLDFRRIAELSGGQSGRLDGSSAMLDMAVMAILSRLKGGAAVRNYMQRHALTRASKDFGTLLIEAPKPPNR